MRNELNTKVVAFANMKGGVGKSIVTSVLANYIFNVQPDKSLVVIDADDMQATISTIREMDILAAADERGVDFDELIKDDSYMETLYDIIRVNSNDVPAQIEYLIGKVDYIFIDLPGNLKQAGVIKSFLFVDTFLIPTTVYPVDFDATMKFVDELKKTIVPERKKSGFDTKMYMFLNKVKSNMLEYKSFQDQKPQIESDISILSSELPESANFSVRTNTVRAYHVNSKNRDNVVENFCKECLSIIDL